MFTPVEYRSSLQELSGLVCQQVGICVGPMVLAAAGRASWYHASLAFSHDVHQLTLWYEQQSYKHLLLYHNDQAAELKEFFWILSLAALSSRAEGSTVVNLCIRESTCRSTLASTISVQ